MDDIKEKIRDEVHQKKTVINKQFTLHKENEIQRIKKHIIYRLDIFSILKVLANKVIGRLQTVRFIGTIINLMLRIINRLLRYIR